MDKIADKIKSVNKRYERLDNAMRFLVNNAFTFTVGVMGLVHAILLIIFWIAGVYPLVQFNFFSGVRHSMWIRSNRSLLPGLCLHIPEGDEIGRAHV